MRLLARRLILNIIRKTLIQFLLLHMFKLHQRMLLAMRFLANWKFFSHLLHPPFPHYLLQSLWSVPKLTLLKSFYTCTFIKSIQSSSNPIKSTFRTRTVIVASFTASRSPWERTASKAIFIKLNPNMIYSFLFLYYPLLCQFSLTLLRY